MSRSRVFEDWLESLDSDSSQTPNFVDDAAFARALQAGGLAQSLPGAAATILTNIPKLTQTSKSDATLAADPDLKVQTVNAGVYEIEIFLVYSSAVNTTDFKVCYGEDTTNRGLVWGFCLNPSDAAFSGAAGADSTSVFNAGTQGGNVARGAYFRAIYTGGGGIFRVLWAQNTLDAANPTYVLPGS